MKDKLLPSQREVLKKGYSMRPAIPGDYSQAIKVIGGNHGGWPGLKELPTQYDFVAMTSSADHKGSVVSPVITSTQDKIIGISRNLIVAGSEENALYIHMLAVLLPERKNGLGDDLMKRNYEMIQNNELHGIEKVVLTSDPLEAGLVRLYMHRFGMHVSHYEPDLYVNLSESGGEQNRGLPADRFFYESHPKSRWIRERHRHMPTTEEIKSYLTNNPKSCELFDPEVVKDKDYCGGINVNANVCFVELPEKLEDVTTTSPETALLWRKYQAKNLQKLFTTGHTAVDYTKITDEDGKAHHFIITIKNFNENNPRSLEQSLKGKRRLFGRRNR